MKVWILLLSLFATTFAYRITVEDGSELCDEDNELGLDDMDDDDDFSVEELTESLRLIASVFTEFEKTEEAKVVEQAADTIDAVVEEGDKELEGRLNEELNKAETELESESKALEEELKQENPAKRAST